MKRPHKIIDDVIGIMRPGDWIIADQNSHASIVDGAILSKAEVRFFRHNNPEDLENADFLLGNQPKGR